MKKFFKFNAQGAIKVPWTSCRMMVKRDALAISSRLSRLQEIDGMSKKNHATLRTIGGRNDKRMASPIAIFFKSLKSMRIVLVSTLGSIRSAHWRKICFNSKQLKPTRQESRKRPFSGLTTISTKAVAITTTPGQ
jgi:hypothetical protein